MREYLHLLTDLPHWGFEITTDILFAALGALWIRAHDRKHHPH